MQLEISKIRMDGGTQTRAELNHPMVAEYAASMNSGDIFPPIEVFHDGRDYWLADGFHRVLAAQTSGAQTISAKVHQGTQRDAVWFSLGANQHHGLRRKSEDLRRAVETVLRDSQWRKSPYSKIAAHIGVSKEYVYRVQKELEENGVSIDRSIDTERVVTRNGKEYTQKTSNIGKRESSVAVVDEETGEELEDVAVVKTTTTLKVEHPPQKIEPRGKGLDFAYKAIAVLQQIAPDDGLRNEALDVVAQWCEHNKKKGTK